MRRRLALSGVLSGCLHALLWAGLQAVPPRRAPAFEPGPVQQPLEWLEVSAEEPRPRPAAPAASSRSSARRPLSRAVTQERRPGQGPTGPLDPSPLSKPTRALDLSPPSAAVLEALPAAMPGGTTLRRGDPPVVRPAAERAAEGRARVTAWLGDVVASRRAASGAVPPYHSELARALERNAARPVALDRGDFEDLQKYNRQLLGDLASQASSYGRSGNPLPPPNPDRHQVRERYSHNAQALARDPVGETSAGRIAAALGQSSAGELVEGVAKLGLRAVVELRQGPDGSVQEVLLLESSGNPIFDRHAVRAAEDLPAPDRASVSLAGGLRTAWEFSGRLEYRRRLEAPKDAEEAARLTLATIGSVLTGTLRIDEVTGVVEVVDVLAPEVKYTVRPLRAYAPGGD